MELEYRVVDGRWLQVWRKDLLDGITWDELQDIKNKVFGEEAWAFEVFPAESELINLKNIRHLWLVKNPDNMPNLKKILEEIEHK